MNSGPGPQPKLLAHHRHDPASPEPVARPGGIATHYRASRRGSSASNDTRRGSNSPISNPRIKRSHLDKRIDFLLKRYFRDVPECRRVVRWLARYDPTRKKKYLEWLIIHWVGGWHPDETVLKRVGEMLGIHDMAARFFRPIGSNGAYLQSLGFKPDIREYTPETLLNLDEAIIGFVQSDEIVRRIRRGEVVELPNCDLVYRDANWAVLHVYDARDLALLAQGSAWCVKHYPPDREISRHEYLVRRDGKRFLACGEEIKDSWNKEPDASVRQEIEEVRKLGARRKAKRYRWLHGQVTEAIARQQRLPEPVERELVRIPYLAILYAEKVIGGRWIEFERNVPPSRVSAMLAVEYAIRCLNDRWPQFEPTIARRRLALARYRAAFPDAIPRTDEETQRDKLEAWNKSLPPERQVRQGSRLWVALTSRRRRFGVELYVIARTSSRLEEYADLLASLINSDLGSWYIDKLISYFEEFGSPVGCQVNRPLTRALCSRFIRRIPEIEQYVVQDPICAFRYAIATGYRSASIEEAIRQDRDLWRKYCQLKHKNSRTSSP